MKYFKVLCFFFFEKLVNYKRLSHLQHFKSSKTLWTFNMPHCLIKVCKSRKKIQQVKKILMMVKNILFVNHWIVILFALKKIKNWQLWQDTKIWVYKIAILKSGRAFWFIELYFKIKYILQCRIEIIFSYYTLTRINESQIIIWKSPNEVFV